MQSAASRNVISFRPFWTNGKRGDDPTRCAEDHGYQ
jgi:hypothetical protein